MRKTLFFMAVSLALSHTPAHADLSDDMNSWFDSMGMYSNTTTPQAIQGQTGSFYTGGSLYIRSPVTSYQLGGFSAPTFRAGCGGIDIHAGSFSFINTDRFTALLKNIANNALGYAFMIAVQSVSPDLADLLKTLQNAAQNANSLLNVGSCQAAESLIGMTPLPQMAQKAKEQINAQSNGASLINRFSDSLEGLNSWMSDVTERTGTLQETSTADPELRRYLNPGNIAWRAMENLDAPANIKELMMSLVGTVIVRATGDVGNKEPLPEHFDRTLEFKELIGSIAENTKQVKVWSCTDSECSNMNLNTATITPFAWRVREIIRNGVDKILVRGSQNFTDTDRFFLTQSTTPLWKLLSMAASIPFSQASLDEYAEVIATEVAANYVSSMLREMNKALVSAQGFQDPASAIIIKDLSKDLAAVREEMSGRISLAYQKGIGIAEQARNMQMINQTMLGVVSEDLKNSLFFTNNSAGLR